MKWFVGGIFACAFLSVCIGSFVQVCYFPRTVGYSVDGTRGEELWFPLFFEAARIYAEPRPVKREWGSDYAIRIIEQEDVGDVGGTLYNVTVSRYPEPVYLNPDCDEEPVIVEEPSIIVGQQIFLRPPEGDAALVVEILHWMHNKVFEKEGRVRIFDEPL